MRALVLSMLGACGYHAGSFAAWQQDFTGTRMTIGCVDLAIDRHADFPHGPVLGYVFGNRCDRPLTIDLQHAAVVARTAHGDVALVPYDPDREIRALPLDARSVGSETIEYRSITYGDPWTAVCVDIAGLADTWPDAWQCFDTPRPSAG